jgi:hypothetical protein
VIEYFIYPISGGGYMSELKFNKGDIVRAEAYVSAVTVGVDRTVERVPRNDDTLYMVVGYSTRLEGRIKGGTAYDEDGYEPNYLSVTKTHQVVMAVRLDTKRYFHPWAFFEDDLEEV